MCAAIGNNKTRIIIIKTGLLSSYTLECLGIICKATARQKNNDYCYFGIITVGFWFQHSNKIINFDERGQVNRVCMGHGKPGKSWNLSISVSRPGNHGI